MARPFITFKAKIPVNGFQFKLFAEEIQKAMRNQVKPELRNEFYKTVATWKTKVYFRGTIRTIPGRSIRLLLSPYGSGADLYNMVSKGTPPHLIKARNAPMLRYRANYTPATSPGWIGSRQARYSGNMVEQEQVWHTGADARNFDHEIAGIYAPIFIRSMRDATRFYAIKQAAAFAKSQVTANPRPVKR